MTNVDTTVSDDRLLHTLKEEIVDGSASQCKILEIEVDAETDDFLSERSENVFSTCDNLSVSASGSQLEQQTVNAEESNTCNDQILGNSSREPKISRSNVNEVLYHEEKKEDLVGWSDENNPQTHLNMLPPFVTTKGSTAENCAVEDNAVGMHFPQALDSVSSNATISAPTPTLLVQKLPPFDKIAEMAAQYVEPDIGLESTKNADATMSSTFPANVPISVTALSEIDKALRHDLPVVSSSKRFEHRIGKMDDKQRVGGANDGDDTSTSTSSSETVALVEGDEGVMGSQIVENVNLQVDRPPDEFGQWRGDLKQQDHIGCVRNGKPTLSSNNHLSPNSRDMLPVASCDKVDENLDIENHAFEVFSFVESSSSAEEEPRSRRLSYVKSIVKNVEEHGSPTPSLKKNFCSARNIHIEEGYVKTIKEDVENWATRASSLESKKGNFVVYVEEGLVKAVVYDVEKRVTNPALVNHPSIEDGSTGHNEKLVILNKEVIDRLTVPPLHAHVEKILTAATVDDVEQRVISTSVVNHLSVEDVSCCDERKHLNEEVIRTPTFVPLHESVAKRVVEAVPDDAKKRFINPPFVNPISFEDEGSSDQRILFSKEIIDGQLVPPLHALADEVLDKAVVDYVEQGVQNSAVNHTSIEGDNRILLPNEGTERLSILPLNTRDDVMEQVMNPTIVNPISVEDGSGNQEEDLVKTGIHRLEKQAINQCVVNPLSTENSSGSDKRILLTKEIINKPPVLLLDADVEEDLIKAKNVEKLVANPPVVTILSAEDGSGSDKRVLSDKEVSQRHSFSQLHALVEEDLGRVEVDDVEKQVMNSSVFNPLPAEDSSCSSNRILLSEVVTERLPVPPLPTHHEEDVGRVVEDVEKPVIKPYVVNPLSNEGCSGCDKQILLGKEFTEILPEKNPFVANPVSGSDNKNPSDKEFVDRLALPPFPSQNLDKLSQRNSTPKAKNTEGSNEDVKLIPIESGNDDKLSVFKPVRDDRHSIHIAQLFPQLDSSPTHDRVAMGRQGRSLSTPPLSHVQQYQVQGTPQSYSKSVSFDDSNSVRSDLFSMVSNLSFPTNSLGSYGGQVMHASPARRISSFGNLSMSTLSASGQARKRISEMIRRDLWSSEEKVVEDALAELADKAASDSQYRNAIARTGGILAIVRSMEQHDSCPGIQVAGCRALEKLALETENELAIGEVGGVDAVLAAMMQHVGNAFVQEAAWSALWNLTCGNACDEMTTDTEGGMHAIVACMKQHSYHPEVQRNACGALTNLCLQNDDRLRALADADGFVAIATALQNHWDNETVRKEASHALTSLLEKSMSYDNQLDDDSL